MRCACERARVREVAVPAEFVPESGGARNLPKLVGVGRAMEMILTGKIIDASEAERIGLVEKVFPHDKLIEEVFALAGQISRAIPERGRNGARSHGVARPGADAREGVERFRPLRLLEALLDKFGVAKDRCEGSSELGAHVGHELRLVLAGDLEIFDSFGKPRVSSARIRPFAGIRA